MYIFINNKSYYVSIIYTHETGLFKLRYSQLNVTIETEEHYIFNDLPNKMAVLLRKHFKV